MSTPDAGPANAATTSVGAWLRAAREAAGLSEDAVAQQLKLAPRQVRAIEEDDYAMLPGRTFVRGFVRNYARLVHLDADAVLAALPAGEPTSPLERLTYTPSSRPMGELPVDSGRRGGSVARWLIPLALLAIVGAAAYYEFARAPASHAPLPDGIMPPPKAAAPAATPGAPSPTRLPNPLEAPKGEPNAPAPAPQGAAPTEPRADGSAPATAANESPAAAPGAVSTSAAPAAVPPAAPTASTTATPSASPAAPSASASASAASEPATADAPLVLSFSGASWVQVRDRSGTVIVSQTGAAGGTLPVNGALPFDVVIGNAEHVKALFRGQPVDLAPHTRANVARLALK